MSFYCDWNAGDYLPGVSLLYSGVASINRVRNEKRNINLNNSRENILA